MTTMLPAPRHSPKTLQFWSTIAIASILAASNAVAAGAELWIGGNVQAKLGKKLAVDLYHTAKLDDGFKKTFEEYTELTLTGKIDDHWSVAAGFRDGQVLDKKGKWDDESRPSVAVYYKTKLDSVYLKFRARFERRSFDRTTDTNRFRLLAQVDLPVAKGSHWAPYIMNEAFHDSYASRINENRLFAGTSYKVGHGWSIDGFAGWKTKYKSGWKDSLVVGSKIAFKF